MESQRLASTGSAFAGLAPRTPVSLSSIEHDLPIAHICRRAFLVEAPRHCEIARECLLAKLDESSKTQKEEKHHMDFHYIS